MSYGLSSAGYDVRCKQTIILPPSAFSLASTVERFVMPPDVLGIVHDKSTWARRGLSVFNTVIEPFWIGWLTLELVNHGTEALVIEAGDPIAQIVLHQLTEPTEQGYSGKYHYQGDEPVAAILEAP
jgi:dCTP deaminase